MQPRRKSPKAPKKRCPYCRALFDPPARKRGSPVRFCSPAHRKMYHKLGTLPFAKFQDRIAREIGKRFGEFCSQADLEQNMERTLKLFEKTAELFKTVDSKNQQIFFGMAELEERVTKLERDSVRTWDLKI